MLELEGGHLVARGGVEHAKGLAAEREGEAAGDRPDAGGDERSGGVAAPVAHLDLDAVARPAQTPGIGCGGGGKLVALGLAGLGAQRPLALRQERERRVVEPGRARAAQHRADRQAHGVGRGVGLRPGLEAVVGIGQHVDALLHVLHPRRRRAGIHVAAGAPLAPVGRLGDPGHPVLVVGLDGLPVERRVARALLEATVLEGPRRAEELRDGQRLGIVGINIAGHLLPLPVGRQQVPEQFRALGVAGPQRRDALPDERQLPPALPHTDLHWPSLGVAARVIGHGHAHPRPPVAAVGMGQVVMPRRRRPAGAQGANGQRENRASKLLHEDSS